METIFLEILNRSIAASWIVLAIVAVRLVLKKAPRNLICALWALVGLRLLLGDSVESIFSLIPSTQTIAPQSVYDPAPVITSGIQAVDNAVNPVYTAVMRPTTVAASANPLQLWLFIGACVWVLGMALMALYAAVSYWLIHRRVAESIESTPGVYLCDRIDSPFILGIFKPRIYLPSSISGTNAAHVVAHEEAHLRRRDHWWKPLGFAFLTVFWFNPILWVAYILLCRDIELACDEAVVRTMTVPEKKSYSTALLECSVRRINIAACPLAFGEVGVKERVKTVLNYKKPAFWVVLIAVIAVIVLAVGFLTDPVSTDPMICFETLVYEQSGAKTSQMPLDAETVGTLAEVTGDDYPTRELCGVNLDESYLGCTIYYIYEDDGQTLYLKDTDGNYLVFKPTTEPVWKSPLAGTSGIAADNVDACSVSIWGDQQINWTLEDEELEQLIGILNGLEKRDFSYSDQGIEHTVTLALYDEVAHGQSRWTMLLQYDGSKIRLQFDGQGINAMYGIPEDKYCFIESDELNAWMEAFAATVDAYSGLDSPMVDHVRLETDYASISLGIPNGWDYAVNDSDITFWNGESNGDYVRVSNRNTFEVWALTPIRTVTFSNGMTATQYEADDDSYYSSLIYGGLDTDLVVLYVCDESWYNANINEIYAILGTLEVTAKEPEHTAADFGITMSVENLTRTGMTLVVHQDGTPVVGLITGTYYAIEKYGENGWEALPVPEGTAWSTIGLGVNQGGDSSFDCQWTSLYGELEDGLYRISKDFSGRFLDSETLFPEPDYSTITCSVEFTITSDYASYAYFQDGMAEPVVLQLYIDGTYNLHENFLSSYYNHGTYEWSGSELLLETDDGKFQYRFTQEGDELVYHAEGSNEITFYYADLKTTGTVPDGTRLAVFVTNSENTDETQIRQVLSSLFEAKRTQLTDIPGADYDFSQFWAAESADLTYFERSIKLRKEHSLAWGLYRANTAASLSYKSLEISGDEANVELCEEFSWTYFDLEKGLYGYDSSEGIDYSITLKKVGSQWLISDIDFYNEATEAARDPSLSIADIIEGDRSIPKYLSDIAMDTPIDPDTSTGAEVRLVYESSNLIIFYGQFGLIGYNPWEGVVDFAVDLEKAVGTNEIQGSSPVTVEVSDDGSVVMLYVTDGETGKPGEVCYLYTRTYTYRYAEYQPMEYTYQSSRIVGHLEPAVRLGVLVYTLGDKQWKIFE